MLNIDPAESAFSVREARCSFGSEVVTDDVFMMIEPQSKMVIENKKFLKNEKSRSKYKIDWPCHT